MFPDERDESLDQAFEDGRRSMEQECERALERREKAHSAELAEIKADYIKAVETLKTIASFAKSEAAKFHARGTLKELGEI